MYTCPALAYSVTAPGPGAPQCMNSPETIGREMSPAACSTADTAPEQSYGPLKLELWPPPQLYA